MLREFEEAYIEIYSAWEKKRKLICWISGIVIIIAMITAVINLLWGYIVLFVLSIGLIILGIYARKKDYNNIKKKSNKKKFKYYDYKRIKFDELKCKIRATLKKQNIYNKDSLDIIIHSFERAINKYDKVSIILSVLSIILGLGGLKLQAFTLTVIILLALGVSIGLPLIIELTLKYILVNKVKYEELVNALVEIELEVIQTRKQNNKKINNT